MNHDPLDGDERSHAHSELDPEQLAEADALAAILTDGPVAAPAGESAAAGEAGEDAAAPETAELAEWVGRVRSAYGDASVSGGRADAFRARRVAQRVLDQTTREDFSRRADLGVILRFAGDRLRDSALLRVAAALLIVQLTLVPLVAWQMFKTPHSGIFQTGIEPSAAELAEALKDLPAEELSGDLGEEVLSLDSSLAREAMEESLAEATAILVSARADLAGSAAPTTAAGRALAAMTALAGRERCTSEDADRVQSLGLPSGPIGSILAAEAHLYLLACGGGWEGLLEALDRLAATPTTPRQGPTGLSARTVRRAKTMGVAISDRIVPLLEGAGESWQGSERDWLLELGRALQAEAGADPYVAAWITSIVQDS